MCIRDSDYPTFDNYDAINVNKVAEIPMDYKQAMACLLYTSRCV